MKIKKNLSLLITSVLLSSNIYTYAFANTDNDDYSQKISINNLDNNNLNKEFYNVLSNKYINVDNSYSYYFNQYSHFQFVDINYKNNGQCFHKIRIVYPNRDITNFYSIKPGEEKTLSIINTLPEKYEVDIISQNRGEILKGILNIQEYNKNE